MPHPRIKGSDLQIGDHISYWVMESGGEIIGFSPYSGTLLAPARSARIRYEKYGKTQELKIVVADNDYYSLVHHGAPPMPRNHRLPTCREEVLLADLHTLTIVSANPCFSERADPANLYVENTAGDDVYIGELTDPRLRNLVCAAPKLADLLRGVEPGNEELDDLIEIVNLIRKAINT